VNKDKKNTVIPFFDTLVQSCELPVFRLPVDRDCNAIPWYWK